MAELPKNGIRIHFWSCTYSESQQNSYLLYLRYPLTASPQHQQADPLDRNQNIDLSQLYAIHRRTGLLHFQLDWNKHNFVRIQNTMSFWKICWRIQILNMTAVYISMVFQMVNFLYESTNWVYVKVKQKFYFQSCRNKN